MRYLHFSMQEKSTYPVCILVPTIRRDEIQKAYVEPYGLDPEDVLVIDLHMTPNQKKTPNSEIKAYISDELIPTLTDMKVEYIIVSDAAYFKVLAKGVTKVDSSLGYVLDCAYGPFKVVYVPNYRTIFYDPEKVTSRITQGMSALMDHRRGTYLPPGDGIIQFEAYPQTTNEIEVWLVRLLEMNCPLTIDIETFSLKHHTAGIATISFAWSKHEGIAFPVDYHGIEYGPQIRNEPVRVLLRAFFERFQRRATYHHIAFDVGVLIYQLYMKDILDTEGLLHGIEVLLRDWDCTKLIAYLATNSCAGNKLGLKDQAQEFAGDYAVGEDIKDITHIPLVKLLRYNLVDTCSTWFVMEKHWGTLFTDDQLEIYETLFQPATVDIVQMQLTGLPVNIERVREVKKELLADLNQALSTLSQSPLVQRFTYQLNERWVDRRNQELKKKRVTLADAKEAFNPNSAPQLQALLYEMLALPVLDFTATKQPSTQAKTLTNLRNHTQNPEILELLDALLDHASVSTILETFIPAMEASVLGPDGWHWLFGNFNLGGTLSGRLSSSDPNLQNLPANSKYAKAIKSCIEAPPGWIYAGLDFMSLEDRISALTTKDPNKLKVYIDGFDGHSLRAFTYYREQMPDIEDTLESINSLAEKISPYAKLRQKSKTPTFALTYQGTYQTLMTNCGFSMEEALLVEARYHELYKVSDDWVAAKLNQACKTGFITAAFGLRVRTPLLEQVIRGTRKTPHEAEAEGRSAGNALGQSWCLLNNRAASEFLAKVRNSEYRHSIRPCAHIHDAQYYLIKDELSAVMYANEHLVKAVQWQEHPDIQHDEVKLGGELSMFWPTWANEITIPNGATGDEIIAVVEKALT